MNTFPEDFNGTNLNDKYLKARELYLRDLREFIYDSFKSSNYGKIEIKLDDDFNKYKVFDELCVELKPKDLNVKTYFFGGTWLEITPILTEPK
jgi:hypothetical protein